MQCEEQKLLQEIKKAKEELQELDINIESMDIQVKEPPQLGNSKTVCGNCHHRGHRNQSSNACQYDKCADFTYCGIREKHTEYFSKLNLLKSERKKKKDSINELEGQVKSMQQFSSSSEHQFIKNLTPRLYKVDENYKKNKPKLMRDVRLIRDYLGGKIPPETTNDEEQLKILIKKCKKSLSIQDQEESDSGQSVSHSSTSSDSSLEDRKRKKNKKKTKRNKRKSYRRKCSPPDSPIGVARIESDSKNHPYTNYYTPFPGYVMGGNLNNPGVNNNPYQFPNHPVQFPPTAIYQHYMPSTFTQSIPVATQTTVHQVSLGQGSPNSKNTIESPNSQFGNLDTLATAADLIKEAK